MENRSNPLKRTFSQSTLQNNNPWGRVIIIGENQTQFNLLSPLFIIGRNHHCNLVIKDKSISSKHCIISIEKMKREDGIEIHKTFIQDFSTHGTFVDSIKILKSEKYLLYHGAIISLNLPSNGKVKPGRSFQPTMEKLLFKNALEREFYNLR
ncbi:nuclear inhibitor of protein phosphatase-1 [Anaeramoeba flamelloides]|uniref:Nuclear inhibitor of protein phosphatase-1 n=1 Tax=Anaeramoeba flamelloides TaxID=1746091 RepID=A0AAV8A644_9EUKA|nr:nuclear inhibitor of protein phosphatase-1 [Anaeramoeba flamelloides]